ncbi:MAG: hypothetical protein UIQ67_07780 [Bacteroidales bacterium]|nr:hypothetical protein [Bacteroidales bacterium]MEE0992707.1 hypothetical protein [Bacteroidales bacterium]MEE1001455.1 hypothetical protein [Bacteroidales bacterium]
MRISRFFKICFLCLICLSSFSVCGQHIDETDSLEFELSSLRFEIEELHSQIEKLDQLVVKLKSRNKELHLMNDTLTVVNNEIKQQLNEKNALLEEKIRILQQKEILFAEKEQVYKDAISTSNIDKAKIEGLVEAKNASIEGKDKEISLLQKSINEKENHISNKDKQLSLISEERDKYFRMSDTLREKLKAAQIVIMQREEELKYTKQRAEAAEEKVLHATNRKKKVRVIQGMAMRFFPTPDWDIMPRALGNSEYENIIVNRNSSKVDFDLVVGASMMLLDLTKPGQKFSQDLGIYVGFGGNNIFKNFYVGPSYKFLDFFHVSAGVNVAQYTMLADGYEEGSVLPAGWSIQTTKQWKVTAYFSLSFDLDFISYIGKK